MEHKRKTLEAKSRLNAIAQQNKQLMQKLAASEDHKSKAVMRLLSNLNGGDGSLAPSASSLQFSDNGIEDREITLLSSVLKNNKVISELDMRSNRITSYGNICLPSAECTYVACSH